MTILELISGNCNHHELHETLLKTLIDSMRSLLSSITLNKCTYYYVESYFYPYCWMFTLTSVVIVAPEVKARPAYRGRVERLNSSRSPQPFYIDNKFTCSSQAAYLATEMFKNTRAAIVRMKFWVWDLECIFVAHLCRPPRPFGLFSVIILALLSGFMRLNFKFNVFR